MYTVKQKEIVTNMGSWLAKTKWDTFSTITYKYDIKIERNRRIMTGLEEYLKSLDKSFNMFWVTEFTNYNYNTHNHFLLKGDISGDINYHLRSKGLIGKHVKHEPYEEGASMYVSKFICDDNIDYGFVNSK